MFGWLFNGGQHNFSEVRVKQQRPEHHVPKPRFAPDEFMVVDHDAEGYQYADREFIDNGVREGWLRLCGWHFADRDGVYAKVYRYRHIGNPPE